MPVPPSRLRRSVMSGYICIHDGHWPATLDDDTIETSLRRHAPDYSNDYLANIPEVVKVRVIIEEVKSLGRPRCLNPRTEGDS